MARFPAGRSVVALALVALAACVDSLDLSDPAPAGPFAFPDVAPSPVPTLDVGRGLDGDLVVTAAVVVNTCHALTSGSGATLGLAGTAGVASGRRLLVLQVQDVFAVSGQTSPVVFAGSAGLWAVGTVVDVAGPTVTLADPLPSAFSSVGDRRAQACTMPEFEDVTVSAGGSITSVPWAGSSGGIVAFFASGTLTLDGQIHADGIGFRGGPATVASGVTSTADDTDSANGARKGEGLDGTAFSRYGRGNLANGGGGGNMYNAGAGGGGNGGAGGSGGLECCAQTPATNGKPGSRVDLGDRLVFGGGGGAGQSNGSSTVAGGAGGGVVLIYAGTVIGSGRFGASGVDGQSAASEGAGGGGAGGTIRIQTVSGAFSGSIEATGGVGGNVTDRGTNPDVHGPGGGGGGGRVRITGVAALIDVGGGLAGNDNGDPRGASGGASGSSE